MNYNISDLFLNEKNCKISKMCFVAICPKQWTQCWSSMTSKMNYKHNLMILCYIGNFRKKKKFSNRKSWQIWIEIFVFNSQKRWRIYYYEIWGVSEKRRFTNSDEWWLYNKLKWFSFIIYFLRQIGDGYALTNYLGKVAKILKANNNNNNDDILRVKNLCARIKDNYRVMYFYANPVRILVYSFYAKLLCNELMTVSLSLSFKFIVENCWQKFRFCGTFFVCFFFLLLYYVKVSRWNCTYYWLWVTFFVYTYFFLIYCSIIGYENTTGDRRVSLK